MTGGVLRTPRTADVAGQLAEWSEEIIAAELRQLVNRLPALSDVELEIVHQVLRRIVEMSLLTPVRSEPAIAPYVRDLFCLSARQSDEPTPRAGSAGAVVKTCG